MNSYEEMSSVSMPCDEVPQDLIPTDSNKLDEAWAKKTFKYAYCFSTSFAGCTYTDTNELQQWIDIATSVQRELRTLGCTKAHEKILQVVHEYDVYMPSNTDDKQRPTCMDDVITIITDRSWYENRQHAKRALIHMLAYGIFRKGYNTWAIDASNEWLNHQEIVLKYENQHDEHGGLKSKRQGKGFVYSNLVLRASNSIADRIQKSMLSAHGEYIAVRKKHKRHIYESISIHHFTAYLVKPRDMIAAIMTTKEQHIRDIRNAIALGYQNAVTHDDIMHVLHELADKQTRKNAQTGMIFYACYSCVYNFCY